MNLRIAFPLSIACPYCQAGSEERCMTAGGQVRDDEHVARIRLAWEIAAHADRALDAFPQLGPTTPCGLCGSGLPQRHRVVDAIADRVGAGEDRQQVADDYDVPLEAVEVVAGWAGRWAQ